jgi:hypothetical protein
MLDVLHVVRPPHAGKLVYKRLRALFANFNCSTIGLAFVSAVRHRSGLTQPAAAMAAAAAALWQQQCPAGQAQPGLCKGATTR